MTDPTRIVLIQRYWLVSQIRGTRLAVDFVMA